MNLDDAIGTIISRGFTERQARFLVLVARHSGVCVMRQYSAFAGVVFGHTTRRFFAKLERLGWVWVAKGDDVFPTVAAQVGDALFREAGVIEPLVLPHAYSHLAPLVGVA